MCFEILRSFLGLGTKTPALCDWHALLLDKWVLAVPPPGHAPPPPHTHTHAHTLSTHGPFKGKRWNVVCPLLALTSCCAPCITEDCEQTCIVCF